MVRPCSSQCSSIGRLRGRFPQSFFALRKLFLPSDTRSFPHRNSTRPVHPHSLLSCPYQSFPRAYHQLRDGDTTLRHLTPSDAQRRTIYALSTPPGKGGVAVIRVSGPDACKVRKAITRPLHLSAIDKPPIPRLTELRHVIDPLTGEKLDDGLVILFKGESPGSMF
jgi:tRNA modification GTPase